MNADTKTTLADAITAIERCYEFMLAYAAQGRDFEDPNAGQSIRFYLTTLRGALDTLAGLVKDHDSGGKPPVFGSYVEVLRVDAEKAKSAVEVALSLPSISSQLVDNLNASIHLRALLTDIFLVDEAIKAARKFAAKRD
jgi:hypothetical protein